MDDYYTLLELDRTASLEAIRTNYRRLAMKWHPDTNGNSKEAEERFKKLSEAYSVLSDESRRREYDTYGSGEKERREYDVYGTREEGRQEDYSGRQESQYRYWGFQGFSGFTREQASFVFMNEMLRLAAELTLQNVAWKDIAEQLMRRGCPPTSAQEIARELERRRKLMIRTQAKPYFIRSAFSGFIGFLLMGTFMGAGLGLFGLAGLVMFLGGVYNLIRALYFLVTGKTPGMTM